MDDGATSLVAQRDALASGTCSSTELIDGAIDRHDQTNASLNAVLGLRADAALVGVGSYPIATPARRRLQIENPDTGNPYVLFVSALPSLE